MNPDNTDAQERETRITALLLGELDATEAAEVQAAVDANPEWSRLHDRLRQTMELVREATASETSEAMAAHTAVRLSEARRADLAKRFKMIPTDGSRGTTRGSKGFSYWGIPIAAAAVVTLALSWLNLSVDGLQRAETLATAFTHEREVAEKARGYERNAALFGEPAVSSKGVPSLAMRGLKSRSINNASPQRADREYANGSVVDDSGHAPPVEWL
jgi:anti-sigma factor RsiW